MPTEIRMPALSPTMTEGKLSKWLKKEGDTVAVGEVLAEIETDKATMEVEAVDAGVLAKIMIPSDTSGVKVNEVIAVMIESGEDMASVKNYKAGPAPKAEEKSVPTPEPKVQNSPSRPQSTPSSTRTFASPLAKRIATERGISLNSIQGSGPHGRIIRKDVEQAKSGGAVAMDYSTLSLTPGVRVDPHTPMRKAIARRLTESKQQVPHFYLTVDCEIDRLLQIRQELNDALEGKAKVSVNDMIIKACGLALQKIPKANASWSDEGILYYDRADVSVAVAIDGGLITPIIKGANLKPLPAISQEIKDLATRAREGKLKPHEYEGGTFSLSNLGMYGIKEFSAIINPPQGCILAIGAGEPRPIVRNGKLEVATLMTCTLSVDHRVIDGAIGAEFMQALKGIIESPLKLIL